MQKLDLYYINLKYIRDLSNADDNVMSISPQRGKENRPFLGVITIINNTEYCIPLTSPKDKFRNKKSQIDFIKIWDESKKDSNGQPKLIGVLNINNMIPVESTVISKVDLAIHPNDKPEVKKNKSLMQKQLSWCRDHSDTIINRANKVYNLVVNEPEKNKNLTRRSSKFKTLEAILKKRLASKKDE